MHLQYFIEYDVSVLLVDKLEKRAYSLEKKCEALQKRLREVEIEKNKYKEMSKHSEALAVKEASLVTDLTRSLRT